MNSRIVKFLLFLVLFSLVLSGCHYFSAKKEIANADKLYSDMKGMGGEKLVPYQYCSAEKFLEISRIEFDSNDFKTAEGFAKRSISASEAGLAEIQKKK
ncbi:MAG TPA: hypothetical protein VK568_16985 [Thermodesulfobacteriota bacterium]|jgi:hypothetical protein|nr:hypothetical protein [Thermodesulfobacteriota bacterium]